METGLTTRSHPRGPCLPRWSASLAGSWGEEVGGTYSRSRRSRRGSRRILGGESMSCWREEEGGGHSLGTFVTLHDDPDPRADAFVDEFCGSRQRVSTHTLACQLARK